MEYRTSKMWYYLMALSCAAAMAGARTAKETEEKIWFEGDKVPGKNGTVPGSPPVHSEGGWLGNGYQPPAGGGSGIPAASPGSNQGSYPSNQGSNSQYSQTSSGSGYPTGQGGVPSGSSRPNQGSSSVNQGFPSPPVGPNRPNQGSNYPTSQGTSSGFPGTSTGGVAPSRPSQGSNYPTNGGSSSGYPGTSAGSVLPNPPSQGTNGGSPSGNVGNPSGPISVNRPSNQGNGNWFPTGGQGSSNEFSSVNQGSGGNYQGYPSTTTSRPISQGNRYPEQSSVSAPNNQGSGYPGVNTNNPSNRPFGQGAGYPSTNQGNVPSNQGSRYPSTGTGSNQSNGYPSTSQGAGSGYPPSGSASQGSSNGNYPPSSGNQGGFSGFLPAPQGTGSSNQGAQSGGPSQSGPGSNSGSPYGQGSQQGEQLPEDKFSTGEAPTFRPTTGRPDHGGRPGYQHPSTPRPVPWRPVGPGLNPAEKIVAGGLVGLGLDVASTLTGANRVFSPISLAAALALLLLGAGGRTRNEIVSIFGFPDANDVDDWIENLHQELGRMFKKYENRTRDGLELSFANGLFIDRTYPVDPNYIARGESLYGAKIIHLDFRNQGGKAKDSINKWVTDKTKGKIHDLIPESLSPETRVVIANALYFNGQWEYPFMASFTKMRPFYVSSNEVVDVPMMVNAAEVHYSLDKKKGLKVLGLPYKGKEIFLFIAVPDTDLDTFVNSLTPVDLQRLVEGTSLQQVIFAVPRMKLVSGWQLRKPLESKGIRSVFDPRSANLSAISQGIFASEVYHKVEIEITEEGTVAAAATGVTLTRDGSTPIVRADRPFAFWIYDGRTETVSFWGTVHRPEPHSEHRPRQKNHRGSGGSRKNE